MAACCGALAAFSTRQAPFLLGSDDVHALPGPGRHLPNSGRQGARTAVRSRPNACTPRAASVSGESGDSHCTPDRLVCSRRDLAIRTVVTGAGFVALAAQEEPAAAVSTSRRALRSEQVPESEYKTLPSGLKFYDVKVGSGAQAVKGSRVAVHYVAKWKGLTFMTSRQGMGVTGGTPYGFDVGTSEQGIVLKGLDEGVEGMRVGGQRLLIVPPELAYGKRQVQELPPNSTLVFDVELLSIKQNAFGTLVKIVEG